MSRGDRENNRLLVRHAGRAEDWSQSLSRTIVERAGSAKAIDLNAFAATPAKPCTDHGQSRLDRVFQ